MVSGDGRCLDFSTALELNRNNFFRLLWTKSPITWAENWLKGHEKNVAFTGKRQRKRDLSLCMAPPKQQAFCRVQLVCASQYFPRAQNKPFREQRQACTSSSSHASTRCALTYRSTAKGEGHLPRSSLRGGSALPRTARRGQLGKVLLR